MNCTEHLLEKSDHDENYYSKIISKPSNLVGMIGKSGINWHEGDILEQNFDSYQEEAFKEKPFIVSTMFLQWYWKGYINTRVSNMLGPFGHS